MTTMSLKLPEAVAARLAAVARKRNQSKSAVVRAILDEGLAKSECAAEGSCLDVAAELAGCLTGPSDLSTHERHLRGYGK
jgi:predicted transcriptional regulator